MGCGQGNPGSSTSPSPLGLRWRATQCHLPGSACLVTPTTGTTAAGGGVPLPACSPGTREHRGLGTIVPLAPWSIPGQEILPWVLSPHGWDGYGKATAKWGMVAPTRHNPLRSASKAARVPWCLENRQVTDDPGPAPYIQHQLIAHPVQDQLHSSNPNQLLIPKPSFLPPMSLSSPQPFAGCSSEPVSAGRRRLLPRGGEEMCNRGTDPGTTRTFPLISRVRAANKATELSRMSPGHNPST